MLAAWAGSSDVVEMEQRGLSRSGASIHLSWGINSHMLSWVGRSEGFINHTESCSDIFLWNTFMWENANLSLQKTLYGYAHSFRKTSEGTPANQKIPNGNLSWSLACLPCLFAATKLPTSWQSCSWAIRAWTAHIHQVQVSPCWKEFNSRFLKLPSSPFPGQAGSHWVHRALQRLRASRNNFLPMTEMLSPWETWAACSHRSLW